MKRAWLCRRTPLLGGSERLGGWKRRHMFAVLDDRAQLRAALRREQQRLGARTDNAVATLQLAAVDGEVRLVDQLVRVEAVFREAGDAERHRRADGLGGRLDLELALSNCAPDPLCDLQRLLRRGLRQQDRELLAAEACRHVVMPKLLVEDLGDPLEDRVSCEMAVAVVDVAQQVEVGHDQRHRAIEARGARDLRGESSCEIAGVVQAGFRVDPRFGLQLGNAERAMDDDEWCERREDQPGVPVPERRE